MQKSTALIITVAVVTYVAICSAVMVMALPQLCANPNGHGNQIVQPICPVK